MVRTSYGINHQTFVYDADGIASIRTVDGNTSLTLSDDDVSRLIDVLQGIQADHERRAQGIAAVEALDPAAISAVYSGRHGCACGCRGNHTSSPRSIKTVYRKMVEAARDGYPVMAMDTFVSVDTDTRVYIAYTDGRVA